MAEELPRWDFPDPRAPKYDWERWMNGSPWKLRRGMEHERLAGVADFTIPVKSFQQAAINYANRHRAAMGILRLRTEIVDEGTIVIQAVKDVPGDEAVRG